MGVAKKCVMACVRACVRACVCVCVRVCACVRGCVHAWVSMCVRARAHACSERALAREFVSLTLSCCYRKNDSTPRCVNVEHHFTVSLIVRGNVTDTVHEPQS